MYHHNDHLAVSDCYVDTLTNADSLPHLQLDFLRAFCDRAVSFHYNRYNEHVGCLAEYTPAFPETYILYLVCLQVMWLTGISSRDNQIFILGSDQG